jgi:hypothetical protein
MFSDTGTGNHYGFSSLNIFRSGVRTVDTGIPEGKLSIFGIWSQKFCLKKGCQIK